MEVIPHKLGEEEIAYLAENGTVREKQEPRPFSASGFVSWLGAFSSFVEKIAESEPMTSCLSLSFSTSTARCGEACGRVQRCTREDQSPAVQRVFLVDVCRTGCCTAIDRSRLALCGVSGDGGLGGDMLLAMASSRHPRPR